ncbi:MAG: choice-of-anchor J domain-containing protein, partial [Bacteroidota bacterium]|nr:choice-of-anchor J domain-containing protein [Bacteroidota bacterium]
MKRTLLFVWMIVFSLFMWEVKAQFVEKFNSDVFPAGWAKFELLNGNPVANGVPKWEILPDVMQSFVCEGDRAAFVGRMNIGAGNSSQSWLVTPQISVPVNGRLYFLAHQTLGADFGTRYQVKVSTNSQTDVDSFTTTLVDLSENELSVYSTSPNSCKAHGIDPVIDLSAYGGQQIYIAFVKVDTQVNAGTNADRWVLDDVKVLADCLPPSNPQVTTGADTAQITWEGNGASQWDIVVLPGNQAPNPGVGQEVSTNSFTATGLNPSSIYTYYIKSKCLENNSDWVGPFTFNTSQIPVSIPYNEGFEGLHGWALSNGTAANQWHVGEAAFNEGTKALYISNDSGVNNQYSVTSATVVHAYRDIDVGTTDAIQVAFDWRGEGESAYDYLRVWLVPTSVMPQVGQQISNTGDNVLIGQYNQKSTWNTVNTEVSVVSMQNIVRLVFEWRNDSSVGTQPPIAIDNVVINPVVCTTPIDLAVTNITVDSAVLEWTQLSSSVTYEYYYSTDAVAPTDVTTPIGSTTVNTALLTGLSDGTIYYAWVRNNCAANGISLWYGPITFNTLCLPLSLPFVETFDSDSTTDICWTVVNANNDNRVWNTDYTQNTYQGDEVASIHTDNVGVHDDYLITPGLEINGVKRLRFFYRAMSHSEPDKLSVKMSTTGIAPADFNIELMAPTIITNSSYKEKTIILPEVNGVVYIAFYVGSVDDGWRLFIDNVVVEDLEVCPSPIVEDITVSDITETTAVINWEQIYQETQWQLLVQPSNQPAPVGDVPNAVMVNTTPQYQAVGLSPSTLYHVYIRSYCNTTEQGEWLGPILFNTVQTPVDLDFVDDFEGPLTWTVVSGDFVNRWHVGNATNNGGNQSIYISDDGGTTNHYSTSQASVSHIYRDINIPVNVDVILSFDWKCRGENMFDYMRVWLVPDTYQFQPNTQITEASGGKRIGLDYNSNSNWTTATTTLSVADLATLGSAVRLVFEWRNDGSSGTQPPAAVDNVSIVAYSCPTPSNLVSLEVQGGTAMQLSWTPVGTETQWEVIIQELGGPTPTNQSTGIIVDQPTYVYNNVQSDVFYEYFVRAVCDLATGETSPWSPSTSFGIFTPPGCASVEVEASNVTIDGGVVTVCPNQDTNVNLQASFYGVSQTTSYEVESIDFNPPFPFIGGTELNITQDDRWSPIVDLPFNFCFFGETYSQALVGSNGVVTFTTNEPLHQPNSACPYSFNQEIPSTSFPIRNAIYGVYQDIHPSHTSTPSSYTINYAVLGEYPCRALVVNYHDVPLYSCGASVGYQTYQIVMYEISNIIEIYVKNRTACTSFNGGNGVIGIQNYDKTEAYTPPGRNTGTWSAQNEAWRFLPNGSTSSVDFQWNVEGVQYDTNTSTTISLTPEQLATLQANGTYTLNVQAIATYNTCTPGEQVTTNKDITINYIHSFPSTDPQNIEGCSSTGNVEFDLTQNNAVVLGGVANPAAFEISYHNTQADAEAGQNAIAGATNYVGQDGELVWIRIQSVGNACHIVKSFNLVYGTLSSPVIDFSYDATQYCIDGNNPIINLPNGFSQGGVFSITPALSGFNTATGAIDLSTATIGTYVITYDIQATDCITQGISSYTISIVDQVQITGDQVIVQDNCEGSNYYLQAIINDNTIDASAVSYSWVINGVEIATTPRVSITDYLNGADLPTGGLVVILTVKDGCDVYERTFTVVSTSCLIPRGISPNGDGMNDV